MSVKRTNKQYTAEFKEEADALIHDQGYSVAEAAKSLGIGTSLLYKWKENIEAQRTGEAISEDERAELKHLRSEVKTLRMEKEILKNASVDSTGQRNIYHKQILCCGVRHEKKIRTSREGSCI